MSEIITYATLADVNDLIHGLTYHYQLKEEKRNRHHGYVDGKSKPRDIIRTNVKLDIGHKKNSTQSSSFFESSDRVRDILIESLTRIQGMELSNGVDPRFLDKRNNGHTFVFLKTVKPIYATVRTNDGMNLATTWVQVTINSIPKTPSPLRCELVGCPSVCQVYDIAFAEMPRVKNAPSGKMLIPMFFPAASGEDILKAGPMQLNGTPYLEYDD